MTLGSLQLSIVIPSFNEEQRLPATLERIASYIRASGRKTEVIVVDDGSMDSTARVAESFRGKIEDIRVVPKRAESWEGIQCSPRVAGGARRDCSFTDADLSAPIEESGQVACKAG